MNEIEYVFYSGGFDTTSYLLQCLLVKKIKVQPIVVKVQYIDGINMKRNSSYHEEVSRQNFYKRFKKEYPHLKENLLDEIIIKNVELDNNTIKLGKKAYNKKIFTREVNQLLYFHQICINNNLEAVVGYQKDDNVSTKGWKFFKDNFKFRIPLVNDTKDDMLKRAKENGYDNFLYETWSCWYPLSDNKACGKCALCSITIVETQLKFPQKNII